MDRISVRELRNNGGGVLDRVERGETLVVTRDGTSVAELRPMRRPGLPTSVLISRRQALPAVDSAALRRDIDDLIDQSL